MPEEATTQVWMTVFSCLVKGCLNMPDFSKNFVQVFTKKNPRRPAETLREGIIPVVRLSFITMKLNNMLSAKLTTKALPVNWFLHDGTRRCWNTLSTETSSSLPLVLPFRLSLWSCSFTCSRDSKPPSPTLSPLPFWAMMCGLSLEKVKWFKSDNLFVGVRNLQGWWNLLRYHYPLLVSGFTFLKGWVGMCMVVYLLTFIDELIDINISSSGWQREERENVNVITKKFEDKYVKLQTFIHVIIFIFFYVFSDISYNNNFFYILFFKGFLKRVFWWKI